MNRADIRPAGWVPAGSRLRKYKNVDKEGNSTRERVFAGADRLLSNSEYYGRDEEQCTSINEFGSMLNTAAVADRTAESEVNDETPAASRNGPDRIKANTSSRSPERPAARFEFETEGSSRAKTRHCGGSPLQLRGGRMVPRGVVDLPSTAETGSPVVCSGPAPPDSGMASMITAGNHPRFARNWDRTPASEKCRRLAHKRYDKRAMTHW
ncbi:unnamed protein product [Amoebophrya sp. A25]|nr:unnamed protein product [Amoebophrya sp. A25]|eukprot:GSA25T00002135001.1